MSFWCAIPSFALRGDVCVFSVDVGVQAADGAKTRRTVLRRFSDFVALAERLRKELGKELPHLPPKQRLAARDDAFLEERRRALEAWIWSLMQDVEAAHSQSLVSFLELQSARRGLRRERAAPDAVAAAGGSETSPAAPPRSVDTQSARTPDAAALGAVALRDDDRAAVRRTLSALQQRYAASKADLSDALACLRSDEAVKSLLSRRVDELERRLEGTSADVVPAGAVPAVGRRPQGTPGPDVADEAEQRCVSLAWQLEEARAALLASESARAERAAACASAEQRVSVLQAEAAAAVARAEAAGAALVQERTLALEVSARHAGERKTLVREVKSLRRDLDAASATAATVAREAAGAAAGAIAAQLAQCLREATLVRERMAEASVERMASASAEEVAADPLELLGVSDARVALLAAEAQLLGRSSQESSSEPDAAQDAEVLVRETLCALLSDNASLRKRVNSLLRATLGNASTGPPSAAGRDRGKPWWQHGRE